jgi:DNA polymerase (family X)
MNNQEISQLLKNVAAAYEILGENRFRINAYTQAADSISLLPTDIRSQWEKGKLTEIPGIGGTIASHLDELLKTGRSTHFDEVLAKMPAGMFDLLKIRTIGPKTAVKLAVLLKEDMYKGMTIYDKLEDAITKKVIQEMDGFGPKREEDILAALTQFRQGQRKKKRMLLSEAVSTADSVTSYLRKDPHITKIDILGSLRRKKDTIGDIDIAVVTTEPEKTVDFFVKYPDTKTIVDQGAAGGTIITSTGVQVDLRVADKKTYGFSILRAISTITSGSVNMP